MNLIYKGKAKELYTAGEPNLVLIKHTNRATAGNGLKLETFEEKGQINLEISQLIFYYLAKNNIKTHYIKQHDSVTQLCYMCDLIPLEVIIRNYASGSMAKKMGLENGTPLSKAIFELSYKNDELQDPFINDDYATALNIISEADLEIIKTIAHTINNLLVKLFKECNITLVDFKIEFGKNKDGEIMLIDEITPDCMRLWDKETNEKLDKDLFRLNEGELIKGYKEVLKRLKCTIV